ncbi:hypothetical protein Dda_8687 [Drechslerella dactyloides]|uniref:FAD-binding domain-containing protein n=1 Tax=Drechslerella dactyloides TaxID=74499 RepID=A0AAD6IRX7_DREDA|nr:hypothetical protein Dda_8687 [Drechslerella dactyloides]
MPAPSAPTVAIVGAGLSGLALAIFITRLLPDATIKIYEVRPADQPSSAGTINMTPNALRVLDHLGVYKTLATQGYNFENLTMLNHNLDLFASVPMANVPEFGYQSLRIERRNIHAALLKEAQSKSQIEIIYDCKCTSITDSLSSSTVSITFASGTTTTADLLIACDGIHSTVRKFFVSDPAARDAHFMHSLSIGGFISAAQIAPYNPKNLPYPIMMFAPESQTGANFMLWPYSNDGSELTFFTTLPKETEEADWKAAYADKQKLKDILLTTFNAPDSPWNNLVKRTIEQSDPAMYRHWAFYKHTLPEKFYSDSGRVIVIGDAAHAMPPSGGQGGAMAFEDAETLAYTLAHTLRQSDSSEGLGPAAALANLQMWSEHRLQRLRTIQELNARMTNLRKAGSGVIGGVLFTVKMWVIWAMSWLGVLGRTRRTVNNYDAKKEAEGLFGEDITKLE